MAADTELLDLLPEVGLFVTADGRIVAANRAAAAVSGGSGSDLVGSQLSAHLADPPPKIARFLALCARTRDAIPGAFTWRRAEERVELRFDGAILRPRAETTPGVVFLRGRPKRDTVGTFSALNDTIAALRQEMIERARAQETHARLAAIVESSDDAIVGKNLDGVITSWNRAAERIFGYAPDEIIGQSILTIIPPERWPEEARILAALRRGERVDHFDTVRVAKGGRAVDVSLTISPIRNADGRVIGASKIARDITERKQAERERDQLMASERAARQSADRANRAKDEFLATLSHELRTPLNAMLGWSQLMRMPDIPARELHQAALAIERNVRVQTRLVDDLLDLSRIVSGKMRLDVQRVNIATAIEAALETARAAAEAKQIRLQAILDASAGPVPGDATRLQQVVWNLVSNAVKFTPKGGRVQVLLERVNSHVEIRVTDTGIGIHADFLPHVFDRFRQAESSTTRAHGGLGIGLAIVKNLVELHGGTVTAYSNGPHEGATFTVSLPIALAQDEGTRYSEDERHPWSRAAVDLTNVCILVVDDDPDVVMLVERVFQGTGARIIGAGSVADALQVLQTDIPDIVLSDIGMPGEDGFSLVRRIKALPDGRGARIPVIALTAFARPEDRRRVLLAGFHLHLAKPVDTSELLAAVATLVGRRPSVES